MIFLIKIFKETQILLTTQILHYLRIRISQSADPVAKYASTQCVLIQQTTESSG
jgi:hypothetical protein